MRQFAAAILPCLSFVRVAYNGANMLLCDQQIFSKGASNLSCDSGNCIHRVALPRKLLAEMEETAIRAIIRQRGQLDTRLSTFAELHWRVWAAHLSLHPARMRGVDLDFGFAQFVRSEERRVGKSVAVWDGSSV